MNTLLRRITSMNRPVQMLGNGVFAGLAPDPADSESPDGRFRRLNVPGRGRIVVLERGSGRAVGSTVSAPDGTWRIDGLNPELFYAVVGWDDTGQQNAAIQDWVRPATPE